MWMLGNRTPYAAERTWVLDKNAVKSWVVVVKGTFNVLPDGSTKLAEKQEEPLLACQYAGEPGKSSLVYEADLTPPKLATDITLNGHVYTQGGKAVREVTATLRIGNLSKTIKVFGDRHWKKGLLGGLSISTPEPFEKMPITYERAFGGWDSLSEDKTKHRLYSGNPVGQGFWVRREHAVDQKLPNIEDPHRLISSWKDRPRTTSFGALASYWTPRLEYAGTYDAGWQKDRFPLLPENFDERHYQAAPEDQQVAGCLNGGEVVKLENLSPGGMVTFTLPKIRFTFTTRFGKERVEHRARLSGVIIEPDVPRVMVVWHTSLVCHHKVDQLDETIIGQKQYVSL
jgi:hypothetical protein